MSLRWRVRRAFWNLLVTTKYKGNKVEPIPVVPKQELPLTKASLAEEFPEIPVPSITVAKEVPPEEGDKIRDRFVGFQLRLYRWFPPQQDGLPPVAADPDAALAQAYTAKHRKLFPAPTHPPELDEVGTADGTRLGELAVASPFACYLERAEDGTLRWDLRRFEGAELHRGLVPLDLTVTFEPDPATRTLRAVAIDSERGRSAPGDPDWEAAQRLALCAANNYLSIVRHQTWLHLDTGAAFAMATRTHLPATHPLRPLLWPHIFGTQFSNHLTTPGLLLPGGDFAGMFSFSHHGICQLLESGHARFDATVHHPRQDLEARGIADAGIDLPASDNHLAHFDVIAAHTDRYLRLYYATDSDLRADAAVGAFIAEMDELLPGGVSRVIGPVVDIERFAQLLAALIYMVTVQHEALGTGMWNYQLWTNVLPVRVYANGQREPVDVHQRLVNANFILNVHRAPLMQDFRYLALDPEGAGAFLTFQQDLEALQKRVEAEPPAAWKIEPRILEANLNA
jgi:arachidonate 15-lipoxygenase